MSARVESLNLPAFFFRVFMAPAALGALLAMALASVRQRTRQPSLPRMSEEWLRNHDVDAGRDLPW